MVIPDVHGRDYHKYFPRDDFDKVVYLGDYVDSFDKTDDEIYNNLVNIIQYKKDNMDKTILLLGNHCLSYYVSGMNGSCSGFRPKAYNSLRTLYLDNKDLFQASYQINNYLFTHAGVTSVWWNKFIKLLGEDYDLFYKDMNISEIINHEFDRNNNTLFDVGRVRGGWCKSGGPFWADLTESTAYMIKDLHQVVGHTPVKEIFTHKWKEGNSSITYCDTTYDYYELNI
jgi:hypothetical protein